MAIHAVKQIPLVIARDDGEAIKFTILTHSGEDFEFECPPDAIPEITARFTGALEQAAENAATSHPYRSQPIVADKSEIGGDEEQNIVTLTLFPTPNCGIGFALSPGHAQKISSDLATAAATIEPRNPDTAN